MEQEKFTFKSSNQHAICGAILADSCFWVLHTHKWDFIKMTQLVQLDNTWMFDRTITTTCSANPLAKTGSLASPYTSIEYAVTLTNYSHWPIIRTSSRDCHSPHRVRAYYNWNFGCHTILSSISRTLFALRWAPLAWNAIGDLRGGVKADFTWRFPTQTALECAPWVDARDGYHMLDYGENLKPRDGKHAMRNAQ